MLKFLSFFYSIFIIIPYDNLFYTSWYSDRTVSIIECNAKDQKGMPAILANVYHKTHGWNNLGYCSGTVFSDQQDFNFAKVM